MTYLDFPKMLSNFWKRPINPYEPDGAGREDDQPAKEAVKGGAIIKDVLIWTGWLLLALAGIALLVLVPGLVVS